MGITIATTYALPRQENPMPWRFVSAKAPRFFFTALRRYIAKLHCAPGRILPRKTDGDLSFYFGGETVSGSFIAPSGKKSNSNFDLAQISPPKKTRNPGAFVRRARLWFFGSAPWRKWKFELLSGTHFATEKPRNPGVFLAAKPSFGFFLFSSL